jgi:hypothetical protein
MKNANLKTNLFVIPAEAGIQPFRWFPAFAGVTIKLTFCGAIKIRREEESSIIRVKAPPGNHAEKG